MLLVAVAFAGCRTDNDFGLGGAGADDTNSGGNQTLGRKVTIAAISSATSDQEEFDPTRAKLNQNYDYLWTKGDQIGLFATDLDATKEYVHNMCLTNLHKDDARDADFEGYLPEGYEHMPATTRYWYAAYYPHQEGVELHLTEGQNPRFAGLNLPTVQTPTKAGVEGFPTDLAVMVSSVSGNSITQVEANHGVQLGFEHLFSVVEFTYNKDFLPDAEAKQRRITKITLRAEGESLAGDYAVEFTKQGPRLNFSTPSDEVTVDMSAFGGLSAGQSVFAVVNPVLDGEVVLDIETSTGYNFTCTCPVNCSKPSAWHTTKFDIPVFRIELNSADFAYTSYTYYKAGNISAANAMSGNEVRFNTPSYSFSSSNDNATMRYQPKGVKGVEYLVDGKTETSGLSVGAHNASFNVVLSDDQKITSLSQQVDVTGLPYKADTFNRTAFNAFWEEGSGVDLYDNQVAFAASSGSWMMSKSFHIPANINCVLTLACRTTVTNRNLWCGVNSSKTKTQDVEFGAFRNQSSEKTSGQITFTSTKNRLSVSKPNNICIYYMTKLHILYN